jgi:replicative DNA helicase
MNNILHVEQAVLGCLLHENTTYYEIGDYLKRTDFSFPFHRDAYEVISTLIAEGKKADVICVSEILKDKYFEKTDASFIKICDIARCVHAPSNIKSYAEIMKQCSIDRSLVDAAQNIIVNVSQKKENRLDHAQQSITEIINQVSPPIDSAHVILKDVLESIDERQNSKNELTGLSTGFYDLDKITHGLHGGDLIILAGRPSMGKTLLALNIAEHASVYLKQPVSIFSLEMSKRQLMERSLISVAKLDADKVRSGKLSKEELGMLSKALPQFHDIKLFINDNSSVSVSDIRAICRRIKQLNGLSLVIVDYISLMSGDGENETIRIGNISRGLKLIARDLDVPVIAISQLNRSLEQRSDKRPCMADIRQSGAVEQDADLIIFIYRDEVYNAMSPNKGLAEIIISKHRNGAIGNFHLAFNGNHCRFDNCEKAFMTQQPDHGRRQPFVY